LTGYASPRSNAPFITSQQQNASVGGVVVDDQGPIIGATIRVKGTSHGTVTDANGHFNLGDLKRGDILEFSYVGYATKEITYTGQSRLEVKMSSSSQNLDEVVVVAYGTQKKSTFTGSASVVKADQIDKISGSGFAEALQGMSAGVNVTNNEGNPGGDTRIQIRGISSMSGVTTPLYIVDGMPYDGKLTAIAPDDIASMTVLKDAAASSLYGSRAANGVVVITTKQGTAGKPKITFRGAWGTSDNAVANPTKASPYQQMLNTWYALYNDQYYLDGATKQAAADYASQNFLGHIVKPRVNSAGQTVYVSPFKSIAPNQYVLHDNDGNPYVNPDLQMVWDKSDYDWYGAVFSRKLRQDYGLDVSGATSDKKTSYYISASFLNDKGFALSQYYKRYSFRANVTSKVNNWLSMGGNLAYTYSRQNISGSTRALDFSNTMNSPWLRNADNTDWERSLKTGARVLDYGQNSSTFFGIQALNNAGDYWNNPNDYDFHSMESNMAVAQYHIDLSLPFNIKFRSSISLNDNSTNDYQYGSAVWGTDQLQPYGVTVKTTGGWASQSNDDVRSLTWNNVLNWDKSFGDHNLSLMAGQEWYSYNRQYKYGYGEGIMQLGQFELASTTTVYSDGTSLNSYRDRYGLLSYFGKAEYNYLNRYYISGSIRRDGSSRFSPENRWGNFFSVGASWRLSKEKFLQNVNWLDNLSLRGSYGTTGNDKLIPRSTATTTATMDDQILYAYQGYYTSDMLYGNPGYKPQSIPTPDLKWERNQQWNVGVDGSFINRLNATVEYYSRESKGLLYYISLPLSAQVGEVNGYNTNLGNIRNSGFEFTVSATAIRNKNFQWNIDANFSTLKNEVTYLPSGAYTYTSRSATYKMQQGKSIFEFYMPKHAGVNPDDGNMQYYIRDGKGGWKTTEKWSDVTIDDYQFCGSAIPKAFGSITNNFRYRDFDLSMMWYASFGSKMYDYDYQERTSVRDGVGVVWDLMKGKVWYKPGDQAKFARFSESSSVETRRATDFYLFDNQYYRLRNLTIGYNLPKHLLKKVGLSNLRVYLSGDNLLTFGPAAQRHSEPETGIQGNNYNGNADTDNGVQGARRIYMAGVQVSF
jgi:TonB-linked SusC/RagA family outer membrane protein